MAVAALSLGSILRYRTVAIIAVPPLPVVRRPACSPQPLFSCSLAFGCKRRDARGVAVAGGGFDGVARLCDWLRQVDGAFEHAPRAICVTSAPRMGA